MCVYIMSRHSTYITNDPEALLEFMDNIDSDFSDDEFDGYISDEETTHYNRRR